jgi:PAS domain S-box-containing protein
MARRLKQPAVSSSEALEGDVLDRVQVAVIATDVGGHITYWNPHAERLFGWTAEEAIGRPFAGLVGDPQGDQPAGEIQASVLAGGVWRGDLRAANRDGSEVLALASVAPVTRPDLGVVGLVAVCVDISDRIHHERLLAARTAVTRALAESLSLEEAMPRILQAVCENLEWDLGAVWQVDDDAAVIGAVDSFHLPDRPHGAFEEMTRNTRFDPGVGLPGRVWTSASAAWIPDVAVDDNFPRAGVAAAEGLHGAFGFPIVLAGRVLGVLEFFSREIRPPDQELIQTMSVIGSQVGQFMERMEAERALRASRDQLETILQGVDEGITVQDPSGRLVYANEASARLVGFESPEPFLGGSARVPIERLDVRDEHGRPFPFDRFPGQLILAGAGPNEALIRFRRVGDGQERWCLVRATPVLDEGGSLQFGVAIFHDVTDRRRAQEEQRFMAEASDLLASSLDYEETLARVARLAVSSLAGSPFADWCAVHVKDDEGRLREIAVQHVDATKVRFAADLQRRYPADPDARTGPPEVVRTGRSELYADIPDDLLVEAARDEEHLELIRSLGMHSAMVVPLVVGGRTLGAITFVLAESPRRYGPLELAVAEELARRAAVAVHNAQLFSSWQGLARKLQESLLPPDLPEIPGMEVAGVYRSGAKGIEVGGDFFDAFQTGDGNWALVIGDVCGKGPEAAVVTGLARHTIRAVALRERRPSRVLAALNAAMRQQRTDQTFCTLCHVRVKPSAAGARLTIAVAGHPLPVVVRAGGACEQAGTPGTLLGVFPDPALHERSVDLRPGDAVVLYTDGVIEARRGGETLGVPRLLQILSEAAGLPAERMAALVDDAVDSFSPEGPRDDVAVLVLRVVP